MNNSIWRVSALAFAAALVGAAACSSTDPNTVDPNNKVVCPTGATCGAGTHLSGTQCLPGDTPPPTPSPTNNGFNGFGRKPPHTQ